MANEEQNFLKAIEKIKSSEKKVNFDQTVDLIINLKDFDVRREAFSLFIPVPNKVKDKRVAGFFEKDSNVIDTIKVAFKTISVHKKGNKRPSSCAGS
jgi:ribosomal protein L1